MQEIPQTIEDNKFQLLSTKARILYLILVSTWAVKNPPGIIKMMPPRKIEKYLTIFNVKDTHVTIGELVDLDFIIINSQIGFLPGTVLYFAAESRANVTSWISRHADLPLTASFKEELDASIPLMGDMTAKRYLRDLGLIRTDKGPHALLAYFAECFENAGLGKYARFLPTEINLAKTILIDLSIAEVKKRIQVFMQSKWYTEHTTMTFSLFARNINQFANHQKIEESIQEENLQTYNNLLSHITVNGR